MSKYDQINHKNSKYQSRIVVNMFIIVYKLKLKSTYWSLIMQFDHVTIRDRMTAKFRNKINLDYLFKSSFIEVLSSSLKVV